MRDQFLEIMAFVYPFEVEKSRSAAVFQQSVMRTYYACKEPETEDALAIFMHEAFIIDERDVLFEYGVQHGLVLWLLFFRMGEKEVCFAGDQLV